MAWLSDGNALRSTGAAMPGHAPADPPQPAPLEGAALPGCGESTAALPLRALTVLAVEDSRFASEALRLMCQRLGLRLRRAETLQLARAHLRLYRPDLVIVDLGLPDGRGDVLIGDLVRADPRPRVVLGTSGDTAGRARALTAGADGFLDKPLESLRAFQAALALHLPEIRFPAGGQSDGADVAADPLALRDDLAHAAAVLEADPTPATRRYLSGFLGGVARHARDQALADAADRAGAAPLTGGIEHLRGMISRRLAGPDGAFNAPRK